MWWGYAAVLVAAKYLASSTSWDFCTDALGLLGLNEVPTALQGVREVGVGIRRGAAWCLDRYQQITGMNYGVKDLTK